MTELAKSLSKMVLILAVKTGEDGRMFGSATAGTIADELKHKFEVALDKRKIHLEHPIRTLGDHEVELRLHPQVVTTLKVQVNSTTPPPKPVEQVPADAKTTDKEKTGPRRERRERPPKAERADKPA